MDVNEALYMRDRSHAYSTWFFRRFYIEGVADGNVYYSHGLEKLSDNEEASA
jgi:hypothetical protein